MTGFQYSTLLHAYSLLQSLIESNETSSWNQKIKDQFCQLYGSMKIKKLDSNKMYYFQFDIYISNGFACASKRGLDVGYQ